MLIFSNNIADILHIILNRYNEYIITKLIMNRQEFFEKCKNDLNIKYAFFYLDVDVTSYSDEQEFYKELTNKVNPILSIFGIEKQEHSKFLESITYQKNYDSYYEEDNPESDFCRFNCLFNLHEIYDRYICSYATDLQNKTLYRIEKENGEGLYHGRFARENVDIEKHPSPEEDIAFGEIFKYDPAYKNIDYQKKWSFAFVNLEDAKNWINDSILIDKLKSDGYVIKVITLPNDFIIEGHKQVIFQKKYTIKEESLTLDLLKNPSIRNKVSI